MKAIKTLLIVLVVIVVVVVGGDADSATGSFDPQAMAPVRTSAAMKNPLRIPRRLENQIANDRCMARGSHRLSLGNTAQRREHLQRSSSLLTRRHEGVRFVERWSLWSGEAALSRIDPDPTRNRKAVPVVYTMVGDLVTSRRERVEGNVGTAALRFLREHHVDIGCRRPCNDLLDPCPDLFDVPAGNPHGPTL